MQSNAEIRSSYVRNDVSGQGNLGGLVGINAGAITNSFAAGLVASGGGGLVGSGGGTVVSSYQISDSTGANYLSLADLAGADAATPGFATWNADMCSADAVFGAGAAVWDFGGADALPRIGCIAADAQDVVLPVVRIGGILENHVLLEGDSVSVGFLVSKPPRRPLTARVTVNGMTGESYTIEPAEVMLTAGSIIPVSTITFIGDGMDASMRRPVEIGYELIGDSASVALLDIGSTRISLADVSTVTVGGIRDGAMFMEGDSVELMFELDVMPILPVVMVRVTVNSMTGESYTIEPAEVALASAGTPVVSTLTFLDDGMDSNMPRTVEIGYELIGFARFGSARLATSGTTVILRDADRTPAAPPAPMPAPLPAEISAPTPLVSAFTVSVGVMLPAFRSVDLSDIGGTVNGLLRAHLDYEVAGAVHYPTSVSWRVLAGDFFTVGAPIVRRLSDETYEFAIEVMFDAEGDDGELEVWVRQTGAPTEEWLLTADVVSVAAVAGSPSALFVPPEDPPGDVPEGAVRPSTGGDVVVELESGGEVTAEIPAGASNDFLRLEVTELPFSALSSLPDLPFGVEFLPNTPVLDIDLLDRNGNKVRRANRPIRVCLPLSTAEYRSQIGNPALLRVVTYHEGASSWNVLTPTYELGGERLCTYTSRFSVFAIGLMAPSAIFNQFFLPYTGDGGVLGLWSVVGLGVFGAVLIVAGVLVVWRRRRLPDSRSARS